MDLYIFVNSITEPSYIHWHFGKTIRLCELICNGNSHEVRLLASIEVTRLTRNFVNGKCMRIQSDLSTWVVSA